MKFSEFDCLGLFKKQNEVVGKVNKVEIERENGEMDVSFIAEQILEDETEIKVKEKRILEESFV